MEQMLDIERRNQRRFMAGVVVNAVSDAAVFRVLSPNRNVTIKILEDPRSLSEVETLSIPNLTSTSKSTLVKLQHICQSIENATSVEQWQEMAAQANNLGIFTRPEKIKANGDNRDYFYFPAMVTFTVSPSSEAIQHAVSCSGTTFYLLDHYVSDKTGWCVYCRRVHGPTSPCKDDGCLLQHICRGGQSWAVDVGPKDSKKDRLVCSIIILKTGHYPFERYLRSKNSCPGPGATTIESISSRRLWLQHSQSQTHVEGVVVVDDMLSNDQVRLLQRQVAVLANQPGRTKHILDPFFYMRTTSRSSHDRFVTLTEEPCHIPNVVACSGEANLRSNVSDHDQVNFWGRSYGSRVAYEMLASYVSVSSYGDCSFDTCIPHLGWSSSDPAHVGLYQSLSLLLKRALPYIESVFSYSYAMSRLRNHHDRSAVASPLQPLNMQPISLRGQKLQVISHIFESKVKGKGSHHHGGSQWHLEGVNCEEIVLTCMYILDNDDTIQGGDLEFQRWAVLDEILLAQDVADHIDLVPVGTVEAKSGRLIVYPNNHFNRIKPMTLPDGSVTGKRRVIIFHLINPFRRICSLLEEIPSFKRPGALESNRQCAEQSRTNSEGKLHRLTRGAPVRLVDRSEFQFRDDGKYWYY